jgi:hypothetical protein
VYPEQENTVILPLLSLKILAPCKARWVWAGAVIFASVTFSLQFARGQRRDAITTGKEQLGRCVARKRKYIRLYLYSGKLTHLRRVFVDGRSFAAGAPALRHVFLYSWRLRHALGDVANCPSAGHEVMARVAPPLLVPQPNGKQQNFAGPQLQPSTYDWSFLAVARDHRSP